jgi:hypothetical protein
MDVIKSHCTQMLLNRHNCADIFVNLFLHSMWTFFLINYTLLEYKKHGDGNFITNHMKCKFWGILKVPW